MATASFRLPGVTAVISLALAIGAAVQPPRGPLVAAVFPPWWPESRIAAAAATAGLVQGHGGSRFVLLFAADRADRLARLRAAGALLLLDPGNAALCRAGLDS